MHVHTGACRGWFSGGLGSPGKPHTETVSSKQSPGQCVVFDLLADIKSAKIHQSTLAITAVDLWSQKLLQDRDTLMEQPVKYSNRAPSEIPYLNSHHMSPASFHCIPLLKVLGTRLVYMLIYFIIFSNNNKIKLILIRWEVLNFRT